MWQRRPRHLHFVLSVDQAINLGILLGTKGTIDPLQAINPHIEENNPANGLTMAGADGAAELSGHRF